LTVGLGRELDVRSCARWLRHAVVTVAAAGCLVATLGPVAPAQASSTGSGSGTGCADIGEGATGAAVTTIQNLVGTSADGDFGPLTVAAVRLWQKANNVPVTGVVDAATWAAMPAATSQTACGQKVTGTGVTVSCARLTSGTQGVAVAVLQAAVGTAVDGTYGSPTVEAVQLIQQAAGLTVTGVTDKSTWKALHLVGTPACSTAATVSPPQSADAKAQRRIRNESKTLAAKLVTRPGTSTNPIALAAMAFAKRQLGKPYVWGGIGPSGYDCSGLQMTSYLHAGLTISRTAAEQYIGAVSYVPLNRARQGDLLFYASDVTKPATIYHVAMYVGGGQMLEAPHTGANVEIVSLRTTDLLPVVVRPVSGLKLPVRKGATGWTVTELQQALDRHGAGIPVDGGFGGATVSAVRAWQTAHKLTSNGVVNMATWLTLG
jgi:peptidoglycan DL-endopeptidase CwlO